MLYSTNKLVKNSLKDNIPEEIDTLSYASNENIEKY